MGNNQNEKVSITFEVEKDFIKAVMLVSGISMKDAEEAMNELDNVVINEDTLQDLETMDGDIQQIKTASIVKKNRQLVEAAVLEEMKRRMKEKEAELFKDSINKEYNQKKGDTKEG